jgi:hypothetical protein
MTEAGPAQIELIRRYARALRELHADAIRASGPHIGAHERRRRTTQDARVSVTKAGGALSGRSSSLPVS